MCEQHAALEHVEFGRLRCTAQKPQKGSLNEQQQRDSASQVTTTQATFLHHWGGLKIVKRGETSLRSLIFFLDQTSNATASPDSNRSSCAARESVGALVRQIQRF